MSIKIGVIEFRTEAVHIAIVKTGGKLPKLLDHSTAPIVHPDEDSELDGLTAALDAALAQINTAPAVWMLAVASANSIVRPVKIPFKGKRKVDAALTFELEPNLAIPVEDLLIDYQVIQENKSETEVLMAGVQYATIASQLDILVESGIQIEGIGLDLFGLNALWQQLYGTSKETAAVIHVLSHELSLSIIQNGKPAFVQRLTTTAQKFSESPQSIAREIQNCIRAYRTQGHEDSTVQTIAISGTTLNEAGKALLENELGIPVECHSLIKHFPEIYNVLDFEMDAIDEQVAQPWLKLLGVAQTASGGPFAFHFKSPALPESVSGRSVMQHGLVVACLILLCLAGYIGLTLTRYEKNQQELDRIGEAIWQEYTLAFPQDTAGLQRPDNDVGGVETLKLMDSSTDAFIEAQPKFSSEMFNQPTLLEILNDISSFIPDSKLRIDEIKITPNMSNRKNQDTRSKVSIKGTVNDSNQYIATINSLDHSKFLELIRDSESRVTKGTQETFEIEAYLTRNIS
jgi:hypothetical protein